MPKTLTNLRIDEVSSVDRGAGEGVRIVLMKRHNPAVKPQGIVAKLLALFKDEGGAAVDFDGTLNEGAARDYAQGALSEICEAVDALRVSICSILEDGDVADKQEMLEETFSQFKEHIGSVVPEEMEKAMAAGIAAIAGASLGKSEREVQMPIELKTALGLAETASDVDIAKAVGHLNAALAKAVKDLAIAKMSRDHQDYMNHPDNDMSDDDKDKFRAMSPAERDEHIEKNPIKKRALAAEIQKALDDAARNREVLKALQEKDEIATFGKRALAIGMPETFGETLRKAHRGEKDMLVKLEQVIKALAEQVRAGKVFAEFGTSAGGDTTSAASRMNAAVAELRKRDASLTKKSDAYVIAEIAEMPEHRELWQAYKAESGAKAA